ncbi:hypothetical protein GCM10007160_36090 [Litchfieldella qijiaojingensis]|uniref:Transcription factor NikR nickel binding C-terminal domain-containing protein n=1 Tax=Litchfieldella qijiaojingensis TaxID=980347 RepID=A0ABQ2Z7V2_9GAMM|nr:hypothetical protein [Halomonas qijiaojingensis]GGY05312.1 hypothetical protein GCM10007160_36090 [Halomonas qijiaojingensis]
MLHVHPDHDSCLEVAVLKGKASELQDFSAEVTTERCVRYDQLVQVQVQVQEEASE